MKKDILLCLTGLLICSIVTYIGAWLILKSVVVF
jgi:hypothetical protein